MKFTVPCFVTVKTLNDKIRIVEFLERIGYNFSNKDTILNTNYDHIICYNNMVYGCDYPSGCLQESVNCDSDIDLFLAIAPLSEEQDYMQWFVTNKDEWVRCEKEKFYQEHLTITWRDWHKATFDEIIKYKEKYRMVK